MQFPALLRQWEPDGRSASEGRPAVRLLWLTADGRAPNGLVADASLRQFIALERAELLVIVGSVKRWQRESSSLEGRRTLSPAEVPYSAATGSTR